MENEKIVAEGNLQPAENEISLPAENEVSLPAENEVYWGRTKESAIIPTKRDEDAGFDIYAAERDREVAIAPHATVKISTGICSAFHPSKVVILKERGSTGVLGIGQRAGVIDSGFRNEWQVVITNTGDKPLLLTNTPDLYKEHAEVLNVYDIRKAICQAVFVDVPKLTSKEMTADAIQALPSERGLGAFASTNK